MRKVIVVAVREYLAAVKTKAFIISLVLMPIFMGGGIVLPYLLKDKVDISDKRVAVLDHTGLIDEAITAAATKRNQEEIFPGERDGRKQVKPRFVMKRVEAVSDDPTRVDFELSERVRKGELFAFLVIGADVIDPGDDPTPAAEAMERPRASVRYHSNSPTYEDFQRWVSRPINDRIQQLRFQAARLDPGVVEKATKWTSIQNLGLVSLDEHGNMIEAERINEMASYFVPFGLMMLMFMAVMIGASPLLQSVLEEKTLRIAEVLIASVPPFQLMMGKLIGMVGVSLTLVTLYLLGGTYAIARAGYWQHFPVHVVWWFVLFQALAVLMFGSLFIAIGAAVSDIKEAQSMMTPLMIFVITPMFVWLNVVREPSSTLSVALSLIPPLTPMLMMLRQCVPPGIPIWQPLLGVCLVLLTTVTCVFAAGRVFRVGILMQGKGAKLGEMLRWVVRG